MLDIADHLRDESGVNNRLDGRIFSDGEDLADSDHSVVLVEDIALADRGDEICKDVHRVGRPEKSK